MVKVGESYSSPRSLWFSAPKGSVAGPKLYVAYEIKIQEVAVPSGNSLHSFADDHGIKNSFKASDRGMEKQKY